MWRSERSLEIRACATHTTPTEAGSGITGYPKQVDGNLGYEVAGEGETLVLSYAGFLDSRR
jgi:hypothetical protein